MKTIIKVLLSLPIVTAFFSATAQTPLDTIKTGKANDPMIVNPGKPNDEMAVKPAVPNDAMAVMTDTGFLNKNIADNLMEIKLSELGRDKTTSPSVKKVASQMITDHTAILQDLKKIAASKETAPQNGDRKMGNLPPLKIEKGSDFNSTWASAMLTMHEAKIAELEKFQTVTLDADIKAAIGKALPKIRLHNKMLLMFREQKLPVTEMRETH